MTYMGSTLRYDEKQFDDHPFICIQDELTREDFQEQVDCILDTLRAAHVSNQS